MNDADTATSKKDRADTPFSRAINSVNPTRRAMKCYGNMVRRCHDPNDHNYRHYGARGISVCEQWLGENGFPNFLRDMGDPGPGDTLERLKNNKGYSPENCEWASNASQQRNRRNNVVVTYEGKPRLLIELAEEKNLFYPSLISRVYRGWPSERVVNTPTPKNYQDYLDSLESRRDYTNKVTRESKKRKRAIARKSRIA